LQALSSSDNGSLSTTIPRREYANGSKGTSLPAATPLARLPTMEELMTASARKRKTQLGVQKRRRNALAALAKSSRVSSEYPSGSFHAGPRRTPECPPLSGPLSTPPQSKSSPLRRSIPDYLRTPSHTTPDTTPTQSMKKMFSSFQPSQFDSQFDVEHNMDDILKYIDDDVNPSFDAFD